MSNIRNIVMEACSIFQWEKEQSQATNAARKEHYSNLFASMRQSNPTEGDVVNATHLLGVQLMQAGWKPDSIKVRRSEFRRIFEGIKFVSEDCGSWKKALSQIRSATTPRSQIISDELVKIKEQIEAMQEKAADLLAELEQLEQVKQADEVQFSDEEQGDKQLKAA